MELYSRASHEMRKIEIELVGYISTVPKSRKQKRDILRDTLRCIIGISNGFLINSNQFNLY